MCSHNIIQCSFCFLCAFFSLCETSHLFQLKCIFFVRSLFQCVDNMIHFNFVIASPARHESEHFSTIIERLWILKHMLVRIENVTDFVGKLINMQPVAMHKSPLDLFAVNGERRKQAEANRNPWQIVNKIDFCRNVCVASEFPLQVNWQYGFWKRFSAGRRRFQVCPCQTDFHDYSVGMVIMGAAQPMPTLIWRPIRRYENRMADGDEIKSWNSHARTKFNQKTNEKSSVRANLRSRWSRLRTPCTRHPFPKLRSARNFKLIKHTYIGRMNAVYTTNRKYAR